MILNPEKINYEILNKNKFNINFQTLKLEYKNGYNILFIKEYYPVEIIGAGSFGLVLNVIKIKTGQKMAVKIIAKNNTNLDSDYLNKEVKILNSLELDIEIKYPYSIHIQKNITSQDNTLVFDGKKDFFENKIVILLLNYESNVPENKNELIEKYKKEYSIQTIPLINIANSNINNKDIFDYNIFYNFTENIIIQNILLAISNMHIPLDLTNKDKAQLNNIILNEIETPLYFEININKEKINPSEYYEISLDISKSSGYNIFISGSNPYPNIRNNLNNFMKYENNLNPIIRIKSGDIKNNSFYLGIEGNINFNLIIKRCMCDGDINNFSSIQEIELIAIGVGLPIVKVTRDKESKTKDEFIFLVDITHDRQEFKYKNIIKTRADFNKSLESAINALEGFDGLEEYAEDLASFK